MVLCCACCGLTAALLPGQPVAIYHHLFGDGRRGAEGMDDLSEKNRKEDRQDVNGANPDWGGGFGLSCADIRHIDASEIAEAVYKLCMKVTCVLPPENIAALERAMEEEKSPQGRQALARILENHRLAGELMQPACQDTGIAVVFIELGQDVHVCGGDLNQAIDEGVRRGYSEAYLRKSVVHDPLFGRVNTKDNTPAIVHLQMVPGCSLKITVVAKGGGAENMSGLAMLTPASGVEGVRNFVVDQVRKAGPNACPPVIVGVGVGGNFETVAFLAKKALIRPVGERNPNPKYAALEEELLREINGLGIGPQGFGGSVTALAVHIEAYPCHIASLPVAVNLNCHVAPHSTVIL